MKKILTVSLFAIMAVSAANAEIASTQYVTDRTGAVSFADGNAKGKTNLTDAIVAVDNYVLGLSGEVEDQIAAVTDPLSDRVDAADGKIQTLENALKADGTTGKAIADNAAAISAMDAAYKAADTTTLNSAKAYADGLATNYDAAGSAAQALTDAKAYTDGEISTLEASLGTTSGDLNTLTTRVGTAEGKITTIEGQQTSQDSKITSLENALKADGTTGKAIADNAAAISAMDAAYKAADTTTLNSAKAYADGLATNYDAAGSAAQALTDAKAYTDTLANGAVKDNTDAISAINNTSTGILAQAKSYADTKASEAEGSASKVAGDLADYISTNNTAVQKAQADATQALSDANTKSAQALTDAKAFTTAQIEALGKLATVDTACATGVTDCALVIRSGEIKWEKVSY